jgi:hypothetical protein
MWAIYLAHLSCIYMEGFEIAWKFNLFKALFL